MLQYLSGKGRSVGACGDDLIPVGLKAISLVCGGLAEPNQNRIAVRDTHDDLLLVTIRPEDLA